MSLCDYGALLGTKGDIEEQKIELLIESVDLYQEAGEHDGKPKTGIVDKILQLFKSIHDGINDVIQKSAKKELTPEQLQEPANISKKNFTAIQKFLNVCLKVIKLPITALAKMIQHPAKTLVGVILGFTAVNMFKEYKASEEFRKSHDIPVKKEDCLNQLKTCQTICSEADKKLKQMYAAKKNEESKRAQNNKNFKQFISDLPKEYQNLNQAQVNQAIKKLTKEKESKPGKEREIKLQKSIVALKKMNDMMTDKNTYTKHIQTAEKKIGKTQKEFKDSSKRIADLETYMNNDVTGFFNHVAKSVHQVSGGFQRLLKIKSGVKAGGKVAASVINKGMKNTDKAKKK